MNEFMDNPVFRVAEGQMRELHILIRDGKSESDQADELREAVADAWDVLSDAEQYRLRRLSAELAMIYDSEVPPPAARLSSRLSKLNRDRRKNMRKGRHYLGDGDAAKRKKLLRLRESGDWDGALEFLRNSPSLFTPASKALLRAMFYSSMGHRDSALTFLDKADAEGIDRRNSIFIRSVILRRGGKISEAVSAVQAFLARPDLTDEEFITVAEATYATTATSPEARRVLRHQLESRVSDPGWGSDKRKLYLGHAHTILANLYTSDRNIDETRRHAELAYELSPTPVSALQLGVLLFKSDPRRAYDLLVAADSAGVSEWSGYFLVPLTAASGAFDSAIRIADRWLTRDIDPRVRASLLQSRAHSKMQLGASVESVLPDVEESVRIAADYPEASGLKSNLMTLYEAIAQSKRDRAELMSRISTATPQSGTDVALGHTQRMNEAYEAHKELQLMSV